MISHYLDIRLGELGYYWKTVGEYCPIILSDRVFNKFWSLGQVGQTWKVPSQNWDVYWNFNTIYCKIHLLRNSIPRLARYCHHIWLVTAVVLAHFSRLWPLHELMDIMPMTLQFMIMKDFIFVKDLLHELYLSKLCDQLWIAKTHKKIRPIRRKINWNFHLRNHEFNKFEMLNKTCISVSIIFMLICQSKSRGCQ